MGLGGSSTAGLHLPSGKLNSQISQGTRLNVYVCRSPTLAVPLSPYGDDVRGRLPGAGPQC